MSVPQVALYALLMFLRIIAGVLGCALLVVSPSLFAAVVLTLSPSKDTRVRQNAKSFFSQFYRPTRTQPESVDDNFRSLGLTTSEDSVEHVTPESDTSHEALYKRFLERFKASVVKALTHKPPRLLLHIASHGNLGIFENLDGQVEFEEFLTTMQKIVVQTASEQSVKSNKLELTLVLDCCGAGSVIPVAKKLQGIGGLQGLSLRILPATKNIKEEIADDDGGLEEGLSRTEIQKWMKVARVAVGLEHVLNPEAENQSETLFERVLHFYEIASGIETWNNFEGKTQPTLEDVLKVSRAYHVHYDEAKYLRGYFLDFLRKNKIKIDPHHSGLPLPLADEAHFLTVVLQNRAPRTVRELEALIAIKVVRGEEPHLQVETERIDKDLATELFFKTGRFEVAEYLFRWRTYLIKDKDKLKLARYWLTEFGGRDIGLDDFALKQIRETGRSLEDFRAAFHHPDMRDIETQYRAIMSNRDIDEAEREERFRTFIKAANEVIEGKKHSTHVRLELLDEARLWNETEMGKTYLLSTEAFTQSDFDFLDRIEAGSPLGTEAQKWLSSSNPLRRALILGALPREESATETNCHCLLNDPDTEVRRLAAMNIARYSEWSPRIINALLRGLVASDPSIIKSTLVALGSKHIQDDRLYLALMRLARFHWDPDVRVSAYGATRNIRSTLGPEARALNLQFVRTCLQFFDSLSQ